jgi:hypothetical protein
MIRMSVLRQHISYLLLICANLGYGTVLIVACAHLGCSATLLLYYHQLVIVVIFTAAAASVVIKYNAPDVLQVVLMVWIYRLLLHFPLMY